MEKRLPHAPGELRRLAELPRLLLLLGLQDGHLFNSSNYKNDEIETLVDETLHMEVDNPEYAPKTSSG